MDIQDYVNLSPPSSNLRRLDTCLVEVDMPSPIDFYMIQSRKYLFYGTSERIVEMPSLGGLLLLGLVSTAEGYFRSILSACLNLCPISQRFASEKSINLGGVLWHGNKEFRRSAFEHISFTSEKELKSASSGYLNFTLAGGQFAGLLRDYDEICNVRHGLVHNSGILPGRNATQIDIPKFGKSVRIDINFPYLQSAGAAIDSLIVTFNRNLFREMGSRWAVAWRQRADWDPARENQRFKEIWDTFLCREELKGRQGRSKIKAASCMAAIKAEHGL